MVREDRPMKNVSDIYPLTAAQSGILFHTLFQKGSDKNQESEKQQSDRSIRRGVYVNQFTCQLTGQVDPALFKQAWVQIVERHAVLRTAILWEGLDQPLQVVRTSVELPWQLLDWRTERAQSEKLQDFLRSDRTQEFNLAQAPLLRVALIRLTDDTYQFIWSNHHILYDGWSLLLVWQNVLSVYAALNNGEEIDLPEPRPFRDYIAWSQQQDMQAAETFWRSQLKGFSAPTPLPAASTGTIRSDRPYQQQSICLDTDFTQQLKMFGRQHRLTLNTLVQGAWALLLHHYSDGDRPADEREYLVTYGSVVSGRPAALSGVESMVGLFINTLPVAVPVRPEQSLLSWLQQRQQQLLEIRQHETAPLSDIQRWINREDDDKAAAGSTLFESIVAFENMTVAAAPALEFQVGDRQYLEQSNYPLALLIFPQGTEETGTTQQLDVRLLYDVDRFEKDAIARLLRHLTSLLTAFVTSPSASLSELPRITEADRALTIPTRRDYPAHSCIHQLIEAQVNKTPQATALVFGDRQLSYRALNQQANQLALKLREQGISAGDFVALCLPRSLSLCVAILAILKAGAAYVPLDPTYPKSRIAYCLKDTQPQLLVTERTVDLPETGVACLYLDGLSLDGSPDDSSLGARVIPNPPNIAKPTNPAYVIYTSGSTGQPKGVVVSHQNLVHSTTARFQVYSEPVERFLLLSSIAFDSSIAGLFWTLCQGGSLVLAPRRIEQDLQQLTALIEQQRITHTLCVPTLYTLLLNHADSAQLASLKTVIVAGEACSRTLAQQHALRLPAAELYNEYGPTEATVWATAYRVPPVLSPGPVAIGVPISNASVQLLSAKGKSVPVGAIGEIYIGGDGVSQGYLNQPEKTAAAFVRIEGQPFYRTGDFGRYRSDGTLEWLGRCDRQVKIRGYRIELGEIEDVLRLQPGVQSAVVVARDTQIDSLRTNDTVDSSVERLVEALAKLPAEQANALLVTVEGGA